MKRHLLIAASLLALAACDPNTADLPAGQALEDGTFGNATMNNVLIQSGQKSYVQGLGERFAAEVPSTITFEFDSAQLDAAARATLDRQAHWIRQFPEVRFSVYGHTDLVGSAAYNHQLGLRRANAVVSHLVSRGVSRSRLDAKVSLGQSQPLIVTPGPERRNRRTVTEVSGFVQRHPTVLNGRYALIIQREYVASATRPVPPISRAGATLAATGN
jgi:outer membrane protein OmpA-like peptidoglycan-associated protein